MRFSPWTRLAGRCSSWGAGVGACFYDDRLAGLEDRPRSGRPRRCCPRRSAPDGLRSSCSPARPSTRLYAELRFRDLEGNALDLSQTKGWEVDVNKWETAA